MICVGSIKSSDFNIIAVIYDYVIVNYNFDL